MAAPAAPAAQKFFYNLRCNKTQLRALVADYTASFDWVPDLPSVRDKRLSFGHQYGVYWFDWFPFNGVRFIFWLCGVQGKNAGALLYVQRYDWHTPLQREVIRIPFDDLNSRGFFS